MSEVSRSEAARGYSGRLDRPQYGPAPSNLARQPLA